MRCTKFALTALLLLAGILVACSDRGSLTDPILAESGGDKRPPQPDPEEGDVYAIWLANISAAYNSITEWVVTPIEIDKRTGDFFLVRPEGWPDDHYVLIEIPGANEDPELGAGITIAFPAGNEPFFANAIFYTLSGAPAIKNANVYMHEDPTRYGPEVLGNVFSTFQLFPSGDETYAIQNLAVRTRIYDPVIPPMFEDLEQGITGLPDRGDVIIPGGVPPEDGDD